MCVCACVCGGCSVCFCRLCLLVVFHCFSFSSVLLFVQVSIVFFTDDWKPDSFYDKIKANKDLGMHTLCLVGTSRLQLARLFCSLAPLSNCFNLLGCPRHVCVRAVTLPLWPLVVQTSR